MYICPMHPKRIAVAFLWACTVHAAGLSAGVARVDITDRDAGPVNDPLYVKALVLGDGGTTLAIVTVDAVALGEIGRIGNDFLPTVRSRIENELGIKPANVLINASHCHGVVCADRGSDGAGGEESARMVPVNVGAGSGHEDGHGEPPVQTEGRAGGQFMARIRAAG